MPDPRAVQYEIVVEAGDWPPEAALEDAVARVCAALSPLADGSITFAFTDDASMQTMNREWRGKDKATNVLSFPDGDPGEDGRTHLGDVILAHETLMRESTALDIPFTHHLTHLLLHGGLHLLGYDHIEDEDAAVMENLEIRILEDMGIKNPYQNDDSFLD